MDITKKKVIFIDLDDTLISTRTGNKFPAGIWDMKLNLPVFDQLKKLHPLAVLIASNQGGIELGIVPQQLFEPKFIYVIASLQEYIGLNTLVAGQFCVVNDVTNENRKPNCGMLNSMLKQFEDITKINIENTECLMIGDASGKPGDHSDTDRKTAENFGCDYLDVKEFIEMELPEPLFKVINVSTGDVISRDGQLLENIPESGVRQLLESLEVPAKDITVVPQLWVKPKEASCPTQKKRKAQMKPLRNTKNHDKNQ